MKKNLIESFTPMKKPNLLSIAILLLCVLVSSCKDDNNELTREGWIRVLPLELSFPAAGGNQDVYLDATNDVIFSDLQYRVIGNGSEWCELSLTENLLKVTVDPTYYEEPRATVVLLTYGNLTREIPVSQSASAGSEDIKMKVSSATATTEEVESEQRGIVNSFDGDYASYFNSKFGAFNEWPFLITYTLADCDAIDYIVYHPRTDNGTKYGAFNEFEIWVTTKD
ncbi:MAG: BACON domain-containing protein, partial [Bacteroidales bacterium]